MATFSYASNADACLNVLCPTRPVRLLRREPQLPIDFSLGRGLSRLQLESGGFSLGKELAALLGLRDPAAALVFVVCLCAFSRLGLAVPHKSWVHRVAKSAVGRGLASDDLMGPS